jgi:hypothetical protein
MLMCHATIKQSAIYADLSPEHLQSSVECLTATLPVPVTSIATEKPGATKTATCVVEFPLSA